MNSLDAKKCAPVEGEFFLCEKCRMGDSPNLCTSCRHNIDLVDRLKQANEFLRRVNGELKSDIGVLRAMSRNSGC